MPALIPQAALLLLVLLCTQGVCGQGSNTLPGIKVDPNTQYLVDSYGRTRIFHGVNVVVKVPPYHPDTTTWSPTMSLTTKDMQRLQEWGFTAVRLGMMWPGVEPRRAQYNTTYMDIMEGIVNDLGSHGIYSMLDVHQDAMSRQFCGEGIPDFAVQPDVNVLKFPFPLPVNITTDPKTGYPDLNQCEQRLFFLYYLTVEASSAFENLWGNYNGVLDYFAEFWQYVATRYQKNPAVLGYELLNEPWPGNVFKYPKLLEFGKADKEKLQPVYEKLHNSIRTVDDTHIIFYEPSVINYGNVGFTQGPGNASYNDRQALAYHQYCPDINTTSGDPVNIPFCDGDYQLMFEERQLDIQRLGGGQYMTEFGAHDNTKIGNQALDGVVDAADQHLVSWNYWMYKWYGDITTQAGNAESFYYANGTLQYDKIKTLSRTYAYAIAGIPTLMWFDPQSANFELRYKISTNVTQGYYTEVFLNTQMWYAQGFDVTITPSTAASWDGSVNNNRITIVHSARADDGSELKVEIAPKNSVVRKRSNMEANKRKRAPVRVRDDTSTQPAHK